MSSLESCSIKVPTIRGAITGTYQEVDDSTKMFEFVLPGNMAGEFRMRFSPTQEVTLNGEMINNLHSAIPLEPGVNKLIIKEGDNQ